MAIPDFVRPVGSGDPDYVGFHIVTMGQRVSDVTAGLFAENKYQEYLLVHGLGSARTTWRPLLPELEQRYDVISVDLPFAQRRYCNAFAVDRVKMLSDHKDTSFGRSYGTLLESLRIECRAIFVLDRDNVIRYVEYVKETSEHPDYEPALRTARALAGEAQVA